MGYTKMLKSNLDPFLPLALQIKKEKEEGRL